MTQLWQDCPSALLEGYSKLLMSRMAGRDTELESIVPAHCSRDCRRSFTRLKMIIFIRKYVQICKIRR